MPIVASSLQLLESFRFEDENEDEDEDEDENDDQVQLLLIVRMLKSVTVMAWQCCCNQLRRPGLVEDEKGCGENSASSSSSSSNLQLSIVVFGPYTLSFFTLLEKLLIMKKV